MVVRRYFDRTPGFEGDIGEISRIVIEYVDTVVPPTTDPTGDPTQDPPAFTYESVQDVSLQTAAVAGVNRKLVVGVHVESATVTIDGCTLNDVTYSYTHTAAAEGDNKLRVFVFDVADTVTAGTVFNIEPVWSAVPGGDAQIHVFHLENVTGAAAFATANDTASTSLSADITTTVAGSVVLSFCGTGTISARTTTYGTVQTAATDGSSTSAATIEEASGAVGVQSIAWTGALANRVVAVSVEVGAIAPAPEPPAPPAGATTIWDTKIAVSAALQASGFGTTAVHDGVVRTMTGRVSQVGSVRWDAGEDLVNVWEIKTRPDSTNLTSSTRRLIGQTRPNATDAAVWISNNANDLHSYADASGDIVFGGGTYHRPVAGGDIYHNWEAPSPSSSAYDQQGTTTAPGRGGASGASKISLWGTVIKNAEITAARGGDVSAIPHALGLLVWGSPYLSRTNNGYIWPAFSADGNYDNPTSENGQYNGTIPYMRMGSQLALENRLTSAEVPLLAETTDFADLMKAVVETLYLYGGYIVDNTAGAFFAFTTEYDQTKSLTSAERQAVVQVFTYLRCVTSNGPTAIGGAADGAARRT